MLTKGNGSMYGPIRWPNLTFIVKQQILSAFQVLLKKVSRSEYNST